AAIALETASYVANLIVSNPDGGDARSTADDHLRLIKAALVRSFPKIDSAVSLSSSQVMYLNDVSASVQLQLNQLRDGSATANNAVNARFAQSASMAANIGTIPAARVPDLAAENVFTFGRPFRFTHASAYLAWFVGGIETAYVQHVSGSAMLFYTSEAIPLQFYTNGTLRLTINADGTLTIPGLISGTITNAQKATTATTATNATNATSATTAGFANTCTSASSAALLTGIAPASAATASTVAVRNSSGDLFARYFNQNSGQDNVSIGHVACMSGLDGYWRPNTLANLGSYLESRNITGKSGTAKTL